MGLKNLNNKYFDIIDLCIKNYKNEINVDLKQIKYKNILFEFAKYFKELISSNK